jgi:predicted O-linked N-acetylglucosamine transferase (SPINDLY family)
MQRSLGNVQGILARAGAAHQAGNVSEAEFLYKLVLQADKRQFDALHMLGIIAAQRGDFAAGLKHLDDALRIRPTAIEALINRGRIQSELGDNAAAVAGFKKALAIDPRSPLAHSNLSIVLRRQRCCEEALVHCDAALEIAQDFPDAWNNRGNVLFDLGRSGEALASYDRAVALQPRLQEAHLGRGNVLHRLKRPEEALAAYDSALALKPNHAESHYGRGNALRDLMRAEHALAAYGKALVIRPDHVEAHVARGDVLRHMSDTGAAFAAYDRALTIRPDFAAGWYARGLACNALGRREEAYAAFAKAYAIEPGLAYVEGERLIAKMYVCEWEHLDAECAHLAAIVGQGVPQSPFTMIAASASPAEQMKCAGLFVADQCPASAKRLWRGERYRHERIRVAYVSADFYDHATAYLAAGLFGAHDRARFESTAISFGPERDDEMSHRLRGAFDRFLAVPAKGDREVAQMLRELEIDIAVDLKGFTERSRPSIFAQRGAPIQVSYLGYPGTMAASYIDYILADPTVIPADHAGFYTEKIVALPDTYQVNDDQRRIAARTPARNELGLPDTGFVFCCFNGAYKIRPAIFDIWMRLLQRIDGSALWLLDDNPAACGNLRLEAGRRGVDPERLVFAPRLAQAEHLARHRQADLFVDTLPYNAHTTASDALWAGVPVVTCLGTTFAGRVAASLNGAIGLSELICNSLQDYEALALKIAAEPAFCASLKDKLAHNRDVCPLFDTKRFTRHVEAAYTTMWERYQRGEPPHSFIVETA